MRELVKNELIRLMDEAQARTTDEGSLYLIQSVRLLAGLVEHIGKRVDDIAIAFVPRPIIAKEGTDESTGITGPGASE